MNKYTLKFKSNSFEELYCEQQQVETLKAFKRIQIVLIIAVTLLCIQNLILKDYTSFTVPGSLFVLFIFDYIFITKVKPNWASYFLSLTNILLALIQYLFQINMIYYETQMDYFMIGTVIMIAHQALLISNNFIQKLITILGIFIIKFLIQILWSNDLFLTLIIVFFCIIVIVQEYKKEQIARFVFLLKVKEEEWGILYIKIFFIGNIIDQTINSLIICCQFNENSFSFEQVRSNSKAKQLIGDQSFPLFLRSFTLDEGHLEEYLYKQLSAKSKNTVSEIKVLNNEILRATYQNEDSSKSYFTVSANIILLDKIQFMLILDEQQDKNELINTKNKLAITDTLYCVCIREGFKQFSQLSKILGESKHQLTNDFYIQFDSIIYFGINSYLTLFFYGNEQIEIKKQLFKIKEMAKYILMQMNQYQRSIQVKRIVKFQPNQIENLSIISDKNLVMSLLNCLLIYCRKTHKNAISINLSITDYKEDESKNELLEIKITCLFKKFESQSPEQSGRQQMSFFLHVAEKILQKIGPFSNIRKSVKQKCKKQFIIIIELEVEYYFQIYRSLTIIESVLI